MNKAKPAPEYKIYGSFSTGVVYEKSDDPFQQAEHVYSLIRKEKTDGTDEKRHCYTGTAESDQ